MTTPTTLPVPSKDPRDLAFNAMKLDESMTSAAQAYTDRLGVQRLTHAGAINTIKAVNTRGAWATATSYALKDVVTSGGIAYICVLAHTSGATFAGDLATYWRVYQGVTSGDLADTAEGKGAEMIAYALSRANAVAQNVKSKLNQMPWIDDLIPVGVSDHTLYFQRAFSQGGYWQCGPGPFTISGTLKPVAGTKVLFHGTRLNHNTTTAITIWVDNVDNVALLGRLEIVGIGGGVAGTAEGIRRSGGNRFFAENIVGRDIQGRAFYEVNGTAAGARGDQAVWSNCAAYDNYIGREDLADTPTEYALWLNFTASGNLYGVNTRAGNVRFVGGNIVDNVQGGVWVRNGPNHAHGGFVGTNISHNGPGSGGWNIRLEDVENGETFVGVHCYGDNAGTGNIQIIRSKGLLYTGGILDASIYTEDATGYSYFTNNFCPDSVNTTGAYGNTPKLVICRENFTRAGMWKYNSPGSCYVRVGRIAPMQTFTAGAAATLVMNNESFDTRDAYNTTTGVFTLPWQGQFKVYGSLLIAGTSIANGDVALVLNGTPIAFAPISGVRAGAFGMVPFSWVVGGAAGATISLSVLIAAGTGLTLAGESQLNIEEIT